MALTPEDIEQHIFKVSRRGYDKVEVDRFLGEVAKSYRDLHQRADEAQKAAAAGPTELPVRVPGATTEGGGALFSLDRTPEPTAPLVVEVAPEPAPALEPAAVDPAPGGDDFQRLGSEVADVLRTAHASVAQLRHEAEVEAAITRQRAEREVADLRRDAEVQAALVRQAAERDVAVLRADAEGYASRLRAEADEYAAQVHVDTDRAATERAAAAALALEQAERRLTEARVAADAVLAEADQRAAAILREAEVEALARRAELEAESARADAEATARREELLADAERRLDLAAGTEAALRARLVAAHGDLGATLAKFPEPSPAAPAPDLEPEPQTETETETPVAPRVDLTGAGADVVLDLTQDAEEAPAAAEPPVPPGWPGAPPATGRLDDLFGDHRAADPTPLAAEGTVAAPEAPLAPAVDTDPLPDIVRNAIGRAVQSAVERSDADPA